MNWPNSPSRPQSPKGLGPQGLNTSHTGYVLMLKRDMVVTCEI